MRSWRTLRENPLLGTLLLAVAVALAVAGGAVYGLRLPVERLVRQEAVADALAVAKPGVVRLVPPEALLEPMAGAQYEETDRLVRDYILGHNGAWLKLWSPSGVVLYSTDRDQVGTAYHEYEPLARAMAGETVWDLKESTESPAETTALGPVLEVYTPLYWDETGPPRAVLEVYIPYQPYQELLQGIRNAIAYAVGIVAAAMVGGFYLVYRSGSGQVRRQRDNALASARQLEALLRVMETVARPGTLQERSDRLLGALLEALDAEAAALLFPAARPNTLRVAAWASRTGDMEAPNDRGASGAAWERDQTVVFDDYSASLGALPEFTEAGLASVAATPVRASGVPMGVMAVLDRRRGHFHRERARLLEAIASEVGAHLESARLHEQVESELARSRGRLEALRRASTAITLGDDPGEAIRQAVEEAARMAAARYGALCGRDADGNRRWYTTTDSPSAEGSGPPAWLGAFAERTAALGESLRTADAGAFLATERLTAAGAPGTGLLAVPIRSREGFLGALCVVEKEGGGEFSRDDERLLNSFAVVIEVLLSNSTLYSAVSGERKTLAAIQESMVDGLVVVDGEGVVTQFNRAASEYTGVPVEEALGRPAGALAGRVGSLFKPGETVDPLLRAARGDAPLPASVSLAQEGPETRELVVAPFRIEPAPGRSLTAYLIRDVTAERELERRRDAFVGMASHELRTPMTTILGLSELLLQRDPPGETRLHWLRILNSESQRLTGILDDMLNVSRIQSGRMVATPVEVDVEGVARSALEVVAPITERHRFRLELEPGLPPVLADQDRLAQVLVNLLSNAVKYSPRGGDVVVGARYEPASRRVVVSVADQGIGIAPEHLKTIFTTFSRIKRTETEGVRGTGLGLYIVKEMVGLMGGEVWVESEMDRGSTFCFSLPSAGAGGRPGEGGDRGLPMARGEL